MKRTFRALLVVLVLGSSACWSQSTHYEGLSQTFPASNLIYDAAVLKDALEKLHPGLFLYMKKGEFEERYKRFVDSLNRPLTEWDFEKHLLPFISGVRCGHTYALFSSKTHDYLSKEVKLFPFQVAVIDSSMFVKKNFTDAPGIEPGTQILSINGIPVSTLHKELRQFVWSDGFYDAPDLTAIEFPVNFAFRYGFYDNFTLEIKNSKGEESAYTVAAMTTKAMDETDDKKYPQLKMSPTFSFVAETRTAVLDINAFMGRGFKRYLKKSFKKIRRLDAQQVIIDLRSNGGGMDEYPRWLFQYIALEPFKYYDHLESRELNTKDSVFNHVKGARLFRIAYNLGLFRKTGTGVAYMKNGLHANLSDKPFAPRRHAFRGPVYLLLNSHSFSASTEFAAIAHCNKRCTIIGEETMGGYCGNSSGNEFMLTLPKTKGRMYIPTFRYVVACKDCPYGRGITPDHQVRAVPADLQGGDSVMDFTMGLIKERGRNHKEH